VKGKKKGSLKTGGRQKGAVNKITKSIKEGIESVFQELGGENGMLKWVKKDPKNEDLFYSKMILSLIAKTNASDIDSSSTINFFTIASNQIDKAVQSLIDVTPNKKPNAKTGIENII
jgi:hypothetical protein